MMLDIIITPDPVVIIGNESSDPGDSADTTPDTRGTNIIIRTKTTSSSRPWSGKQLHRAWFCYSEIDFNK
jgi:hypothetical protein